MALDGIFHWGEPSDVDYVSRRLATASYGLYASPDYLALHGMPVRPDDLTRHRGLIFRNTTRLQPWYLSRQGMEETEILPTASLMANDYWTLKYFAVAGQGIAYLPGFCRNRVRGIFLCPYSLIGVHAKRQSISFIRDVDMFRVASRRSSGSAWNFTVEGNVTRFPRYFVEKIVR